MEGALKDMMIMHRMLGEFVDKAIQASFMK